MNELEIRKTFEIMKQAGETIEIRAIGARKTFSGYFQDVEKLVSCVKSLNDYNLYFILNKINPSCFSREQSDKFVEKAKQTTSDGDILSREWILIDIDPTRSSGVSSTDSEKTNAKNVAYSVYKYLKDVGFCEPICADSGNGWHFLYKIALLNNDENKELVKNFLSTLDVLFSDETASIDTTVFNAGRITKLYGTIARKGANTKDRPHRLSKITKVPETISVTPRALIQKVVDELPKKETPSYKNNYCKTEFDIDKFISDNGIRVNKIVINSIGKKYILDECVFDSNHKAPDACIIVMNNGALAYKCFHNSCQRYTWHDVREKFEPDAYKNKNGYEVQRTTKPYSQQGITREKLVNFNEKKELGAKFLTLDKIEAVDRSKIVSIPSGFEDLDKRIIGFNKREVSVWSGNNGSGKSSVLNQIALNSVNNGFKVAIYSGELTPQRMKQWTLLQASGRQNVRPSKYANLFYTPQNTADKIDKWLSDKLYIYNNDYGTKFENVLSDLGEICVNKGIDEIIIDNLMALDILSLQGDKYEKQTTLILATTDFAKKYNVHIHLVCHPRKSTGFLRKEDISGSADLSNAVDNVFIVHRVGQDFILHAKEFLGEVIASDYYKYNNVVEVCKNRDLGVMNELIGLYFEIESKRFLNYKNENFCYGWEDSPTKKWSEISEIKDNEMFGSEDGCFVSEEDSDGMLPF